ncbi:MAG: hypothetical protein H0Z39_07095 [Peptococcaceae bacterium]|nr:hypothetical protein [Peptococcaceae bacterium]
MSINIVWNDVRSLLLRLRDGSLLLGVLYLIVFLLVLPFWVAHAPSQVGHNMIVLLAMVTALLLVHIFLNWAYYALVAVPAIAAIGLFVVGACLWVATPMVMAPLAALFGMFSGGFGVADLGGMIAGKFFGAGGQLVAGMSETISRFGQLLMIIAGWFWWLNDKLRSINYKALGFYLLGLASLGYTTGIASTEGLIVFLYVWLWITYRIEERQDMPNLVLVYKIIASVPVVVKALHYISLDNVGLAYYGLIISGGLLAVIWQFSWLVSQAPEGVRNVLQFLLERGDKTFFVGKE